MKIFLATMCALMFVTEPADAENSTFAVKNMHLQKGLEDARHAQPEQAVTEFDRCKELSSASPAELLVVAQTYFDVGNTDKCIKTADRALTMESVKKDKATSSWLLNLKGNSLAATNKMDDAVSNLKLAAKVNPAFEYNFLSRAGELLIREKKYKDAVPLLEKAVNEKAMNAFTYQRIGQCYIGLNEPAKAIEPLKKSVKIFLEARRKQSEAFSPALLLDYKLLVKAYESTSNKAEAAIWQNHLDRFVNQLNSDFFGKR